MSCSVVLKNSVLFSLFGGTVFFVDDSRSILESEISQIFKLCFVNAEVYIHKKYQIHLRKWAVSDAVML
jgi:hypothetical protein